MKNFMFVLMVAILVISSNAFSQNFGEITYNLEVATAALTIANGDISVTGLTPGLKFAVIPDGAGGDLSASMTNPPAVPPSVTLTPASITGDPGANVLISFALPNALVSPTGGQGNIKLDYNSTSGIWGLSGACTNYFDPSNPVVMTLGAADGVAEFYIGCVITVPATVYTTETYLGSGMFTVAYTGM